ncbi:hypothetical protein [Flavobacterium sp. HSC-61S13]|uniref:hypothetical protein n=1 Tax=Flavobacterium sp. HSC-61S13 TaxID=2910963 RepID=UPI0020A16161|nr:hypothetical protein [Flavobacterium sp. HSC-61S13]MCP1996616.1 hypothetical protein [Flavobacterium sp. HSC-61S13]
MNPKLIEGHWTINGKRYPQLTEAERLAFNGFFHTTNLVYEELYAERHRKVVLN